MPKQGLSVLMKRINTIGVFISRSEYDEAIKDFKSLLSLIHKSNAKEIDLLIKTLDKIIFYCATHQRAHQLDELYNLFENAAQHVFIPATSRLRYYFYAGRRYIDLEQYGKAIDYFSQGLWFVKNKSVLGYETVESETTESVKGKEKDNKQSSTNNNNFDELYRALLQEVSRIDAVLCYQEGKALFEKRLQSSDINKLTIKELQQKIISIESFADMLLLQSAMNTLDELYRLILTHVNRYIELVSDRLSVLCQKKGSQEEFQLQIETAKKVAVQLNRHKQYRSAKNLYNAFLKNTVFAFDFEAIHQAIETINQLLLGTIKSETPKGEVFWQTSKKELDKLREPFLNAIDENNIKELQHRFTQGTKELFKKIVENCIEVLGIREELPGIHIMIIGSGARNRLNPFSDIDLAVLVDKKEERDNDALKALLQLVGNRLRLIGESEPAGLFIDTGDIAHLTKDKELLNTPQGFVDQREFDPAFLNAATALEAYSIHRPGSLYCNAKGERLLNEYVKKIIEKWQISVGHSESTRFLSLFREQGKAYQKMHYEQLQGSMFVWDQERESRFHIKERLLGPLLFWILDMGLRFGFLGEKYLEPHQVLQALFKMTFTDELSFVNKELLEKIGKALNHLHVLRARVQMVCQQQQDIVLKPNAFLPDTKLGLSCNKVYRLTEKEWQQLREIDQKILQPIYANIAKIKFRHPAHAALSALPLEKKFLQAADRGVIEIVKECIEAGVLMNAVNQDIASALYLAALRKQDAIVSYLLKQGVQTGIQTRAKGYTALHIASIRGAVNIVNLLAKDPVLVALRDKEGKTALHLAAANGHQNVVLALLRNDEQDLKHSLDKNGMSPLHLAAGFGHTSVIRSLITAGTKIDIRTRSGYTSLHVAIRFRKPEAMNMLLAYGASQTAETIEQRNALHIASFHGITEAVERLLSLSSRTATVDFKDKKGLTPLLLATWGGHVAVVSLLLKHGARAQEKDKDGWNALHWVGNVDTVDNKEVFDNQRIKIVKLFIEKAPTLVHEQEKELGWTPLHVAAWKGHIQFAQMLLEASAIATVESRKGKTPLDIAKEAGQREFVQWFERQLPTKKVNLPKRAAGRVRSRTFWDRVWPTGIQSSLTYFSGPIFNRSKEQKPDEQQMVSLLPKATEDSFVNPNVSK